MKNNNFLYFLLKLSIFFYFLIFLILPYNSIAQYNEISGVQNVAHSHLTPDLMGGGVAIVDINNDGWEDIYLTGGVKQDKLLLNKGGYFEDISIVSNIFRLTRHANTTAVAFGDINNDTFKDLIVTTAKGQSLILLLNNGDETFTNISASLDNYQSASMGAAMADFNTDGLLDIYVINYIEEFKSITDAGEVIGFNHKCGENYLFINQGENTFNEVSQEWGLNDNGCGLAVCLTDIDQDNLIDVYIANDFGKWVAPNSVYLREETTRDLFIDKSVELGLNDSIYGMGIGVGDFNSDLTNEYYITNLGSNSFRQKVNDKFENTAVQLGVQADSVNGLFSTGWGAIFIDSDNDSYQDLFLSNGYIPAAEFIQTSTSDPNRLYKNNLGESFSDISAQWNVNFDGISRGCAWGDIDNNGFPDIIVSNIERIRASDYSNVDIYLNTINQNNWIGIMLDPSIPHKDVTGVKVYVYYNEKVQFKENVNSGSHASTSSDRLLFGLGNAEQIDSIEVVWSPHTKETFTDFHEANRYYLLKHNAELPLKPGCLDPGALNYDPESDYNWGCTYNQELVLSFDEESVGPMTLVHPNPVTDIMKITAPSQVVKLEILDSEGQIIESSSVNKTHTEYDLRHLADGLYIVKLYFNDNIISRLLIKK
ncbi:MAG: FG-GAP-like repeat-containing protein [Bacteroidota bacterium]